MEQIKLTEKQKKQSLSAQKKAKAPKNVLTSSLPEYWPTLNEENAEELSVILKTIAWDESVKKLMTFGLESGLRSVRARKAIYVILDENISPRWFGKHFISMALVRDPHIKIIIMPKLKEITKEAFKVATIVLCINTDIHLLQELYKKLNVRDEFRKHYGQSNTNNLKKVDIKRRYKIDSAKSTPIVYLKKVDNGQSAFVPGNLEERMDEDNSQDFISLNKYEKSESEQVNYYPMKIKQVFPNPNRKRK